MKITVGTRLAIEQEINELIYKCEVKTQQDFDKLITRLEWLAENFDLAVIQPSFGIMAPAANNETITDSFIFFRFWARIFAEDSHTLQEVIQSAFKQRAQDLGTLRGEDGFDLFQKLREQHKHNGNKSTNPEHKIDQSLLSSAQIDIQSIREPLFKIYYPFHKVIETFDRLFSFVCRFDFQRLLFESILLSRAKDAQVRNAGDRVNIDIETQFNELYFGYLSQRFANIKWQLGLSKFRDKQNYYHPVEQLQILFSQLTIRLNQLMSDDYYVLLIKHNFDLFRVLLFDQPESYPALIQHKNKEEIKILLNIIFSKDMDLLTLLEENDLNRLIITFQNPQIISLYRNGVLSLLQIVGCEQNVLMALVSVFSDVQLHATALPAIEYITEITENGGYHFKHRHDISKMTHLLNFFKQAMGRDEIKSLFIKKYFDVKQLFAKSTIEELHLLAQTYTQPAILSFIERDLIHIPSDLSVSPENIIKTASVLEKYQHRIQQYQHKKIIPRLPFSLGAVLYNLIEKSTEYLELFLALIEDPKVEELLAKQHMDLCTVQNFLINDRRYKQYVDLTCEGKINFAKTLDLFHGLYDVVFMLNDKRIVITGYHSSKLLSLLARFSTIDVKYWLNNIYPFVNLVIEHYDPPYTCSIDDANGDNKVQKRLYEYSAAISHPLIIPFIKNNKISSPDVALMVYRLIQSDHTGIFFRMGLIRIDDILEVTSPCNFETITEQDANRYRRHAFLNFLHNEITAINTQLCNYAAAPTFFGRGYQNIGLIQNQLSIIIERFKLIVKAKEDYKYYNNNQGAPCELRDLYTQDIGELIKLLSNNKDVVNLAWRNYCLDRAALLESYMNNSFTEYLKVKEHSRIIQALTEISRPENRQYRKLPPDVENEIKQYLAYGTQPAITRCGPGN